MAKGRRHNGDDGGELKEKIHVDGSDSLALVDDWHFAVVCVHDMTAS